MRLLLDGHFSPHIARRLRELNYDVLASRDRVELHGLSDADLLALAARERRALVTKNVADFAELHRAAIMTGERHFGLVFTSPRRFPRTTRAIGRLVKALDAFLVSFESDEALVNQTWWLERPLG